MSLRIQSGKYKGTNLKAPEGESTRPTTARTREALWSMLRPYISDHTVFIDLFSGSGIIGLEAASHGARSVFMVENERNALRIIKKNIDLVKQRQSTEPADEVSSLTLVQCDAFKFKVRGEKADIVWADPPYAIVKDHMSDLAKLAHLCLADDGILCLEIAQKDTPLIQSYFRDNAPDLSLSKAKKYGDTSILIWKKGALS